MNHLLVVLIGIPLFWHLAIAAGIFYDAGRLGMGRWKWGTVALVVPFFGGVAYLLERSERTVDHENRYDDGTYNVHESVASEDETDGRVDGTEHTDHAHPERRR